MKKENNIDYSSDDIFTQELWYRLMHVKSLPRSKLWDMAFACKDTQLSGFFEDDQSLFQRMEYTAQLSVLQEAYESKLLENQWQALRSKGIGLWYPTHKNMQRLTLHVQQSSKGKSMLTPLIFHYSAAEYSLVNKITVGIIGAREASAKVLKLTEEIAYAFAQQGQVVVSGYARGVDSHAHAGAIRAKGETLAVLPQGIESVFSQEIDVFLKKSILNVINETQRASWKQYICFLSQFYPSARWQPQRYILRNYTICALSDKMIVMDAIDEQSGSFKTALFAKKLGKPLYVFMSNNTRLQSRGNQLLVNMHQATPLNEEELFTLTQIKLQPIADALS